MTPETRTTNPSIVYNVIDVLPYQPTRAHHIHTMHDRRIRRLCVALVVKVRVRERIVTLHADEEKRHARLLPFRLVLEENATVSSIK